MQQDGKARSAKGTEPDSAVSALSAWSTVFIFFLLYSLAYVDRQILNFLVDPISRTLGISDFQFSLVQGVGFALLFTLAGIPIGWLVDHKPRRLIMGAGLTIWSIAAGICGLASQYWQLLLGRIGLSVGEATLAPASFSILSDIFPPRKLTLPMTVMTLGANAGSILAAAVAGWAMAVVPAAGVEVPLLGRLHNWQVAMLVIAVPGLLMVPTLFAIKEPVRQRAVAAARPGSSAMLAALGHNRRFYGGYFTGLGFYSMGNYAALSWLPTFFIRQHGWEVKEVALAIGSLHIVAGLTGTVVMGYLVDRWYAAGRKDAHCLFLGITSIVQLVAFSAAMLLDNPMLALAALVPFKAVSNFSGIGAAGLQICTPRETRVQVSAVYLLVYSLLGAGIGPTLVAVFTDFIFADPQRIGSAMLLSVAGCAILATGFLLYAAPAMRRVE
ncbi:putative MFS family arabinose efflux permease [Sphingobium sp. AEW010]|nr:putative MFS family arabinose efflux permease [Sphingobium sp. AEW010]TWD18957.1 putative MFS family arabinose efflux permease [Sphingobium sp. AEW013]TWD21828.1 putative MFS family arabinose efflux permease [Sphingobium sp. AEW001]